MAIKIKKKKPEVAEIEEVLDEPDQILATAQESFSWLQENRVMVLGGIGALVVGIIIASLVWEANKSGKVEDAGPVLQAIQTATAPIGTEDGQFANTTARAEAVLAAVGDSDSTVANVLSGSSNLALGNADAAVAALSDAEANYPAPENIAIAFGLASAEAEAGNLDAAIGRLEALEAGDVQPVIDLHIARLTDTFGTPEQALEAYRGFVAEHPGAPGFGDASNRVVSLEISLGVEPVAAAEAAAGEADPSEG